MLFAYAPKLLGAEVIVKDAEGDHDKWVRQEQELLASGVQVMVLVGGDAGIVPSRQKPGM